MIFNPRLDAIKLMKKPFIFQALPLRLRQWIAYRFYFKQSSSWRHLYDKAALEFCPFVCMYRLYPGDIISDNIAFNGFYELELSREISKLSMKGALLVDVGANMGYFSLLWAGLNLYERVISYEVAPRNVEILRNNIERNRLSERITLMPKAVGRKAGSINFNSGPVAQTGWGGISNAQTETTIDVPMVRLDEEMPDALIDVLKIDVEGADTWVLYGCENLLRARRIKRIYFEQNSSRMAELGIQASEAPDYLRSVGYCCIPFGKGDGEWVSYPLENSI